MSEKIEALVEGGKASAGPPLGPALGPLGVNIGEVINTINEKTKDFAGMQVPVTVIVDDKKNFEIKVGTPPASAMTESNASSARPGFSATTTASTLLHVEINRASFTALHSRNTA